jgi:Ser/Thr protein kinase RdoA (MazF antagonist)
MTYLGGEPLSRVRSTPARLHNLGALLARLDLALADFRHPAEDHDLLWDLKRAHRALGLLAWVQDPEQQELAGEILNRFTLDVRPRLRALRHQTVHNDFNPHNLLVSMSDTDEIAGVIDFGDMVRAPLIQDLATASAYQILRDAHPLEGAAHVASAFDAVHPLTHDEIAILPDLMKTRLALTIGITSWRSARHLGDARYIRRNAEFVFANLKRLEGIGRETAAEWLIDRVMEA